MQLILPEMFWGDYGEYGDIQSDFIEDLQYIFFVMLK